MLQEVMAKPRTRRAFVQAGGVAAALAGLGLVGCSSADSSASSSSASESASASASAATQTTVVTTANGPVKGTTDGSVSIFYAIPYAKAPEGDLRWQAPEAADAWTEERDCTAAGEAAIQYNNSQVSGTEDCLNLDVYAPEGASGLPVLVYIHGGNNQTGNAQEIVGNDLVANCGCVYVSLSYRLGLFGFNCLPALGAETGNFTMLDIAAALDWIKANISAFGGDPNNITVSGFSAGGRDVMVMLASPYFAGKFDKAIVYSGGMTTCTIEQAQKKEAAALAPLAVEDGKAADEQAAYEWVMGTGAEVKDWLLGLSKERLAPLMGNASIRMSVFPHLFEDGVVVPEGGFDNPTYNNVPTIMLTGTTEFSFFSLFDAYFSSEEFTALSEDKQNAAKTFAVKYGSDMYRIFNAECSAEDMEGKFSSNIYVCQVNYGGDDSAMAADLAPYGSFHGIFVPMIATTNSYAAMMQGVFDKAGYKAMAAAYNKYLKNFLSTGDPNGDGLTEWTPWTASSRQSMVLDGTESDAITEMRDVTSSYDKIIEAMEADTTVSDSALKLSVEQNVMNGRWFSAALDAHTGAKDLWEVSFS